MILKILNAKSKKAIGLLALLASLGSFIADVLQPLAPFSKYIFFLAILLLYNQLYSVFIINLLQNTYHNIHLKKRFINIKSCYQ